MKEENKILDKKFKEKSLLKRQLREEIIKEWFPEELLPKFEEKREFTRKELSEEETREREELIKKIKEKELELSSQKRIAILKEGEKIKKQTVQRQIDYLLFLVQQYGLTFAINAAKATNDPFLIDLFHDILAKEGLYKKFRM